MWRLPWHMDAPDKIAVIVCVPLALFVWLLVLDFRRNVTVRVLLDAMLAPPFGRRPTPKEVEKLRRIFLIVMVSGFAAMFLLALGVAAGLLENGART